MTLKDIDKSIESKMEKNKDIIIYTFFELRVEYNLSEQEMYNFLALVKTKLENLKYTTYRPRSKVHL